MDSTLTLLKEEINKTQEAEHDLAKWKLLVTAALGGAAFGITQSDPNYWLLLFVPFVCAYVDLYAYQYQLRIQAIARFLRSQGQSDSILMAYEHECESLRKKHIFSLGNWAGIACSLGASIFGPVVYVVQRRLNPSVGNLLVSPLTAGIIWLTGGLLIVGLWIFFQALEWRLSKSSPQQTMRLVA